MKKKRSLITASLCTLALLAGCSPSSDTGTYSKYVKLGEYKGLAINKVKTEVTDDMIQEEIDFALEENATYNDITDRAAKEEDTVNINYDTKIDGASVEDLSGEDFDLVIGEGYLFEELETGLVGMNTGDTKDITATVTEDYGEEYAGKNAVITVTLKQIQEISLPEYNDAFVESISDFKTTAEYEEDLKNSLMKSQEENNTYAAGSDALLQVIGNSAIEGYPEELYAKSKESYDAMNAAYAEMFGMDISDFEMSEEETKQAITDIVNEEMIITTIAEKENLTVSDEDVSAYIKANYESYGYESAEEYEADYTKEETSAELLKEKVQAFLLDNAKITEVTEEEYYNSQEDLIDDDINLEENESDEE